MNKIRTATRLDADDVFVETLSHLKDALYARRGIVGLSQAEMATAINRLTNGTTDQSTISRIEQGKDRYLDWRELYAACRVLDCSPDHLFEHALQITRNLRGLREGLVSGESLLEDIGTEPKTKRVSRNAFLPRSEKVYQYLRKRIILGDVLNGEIVSAQSIANEFRASKQSVISAFYLLQADGCVVVLGEESCIVPEYSVRHMMSIVCRRIEIEAKAVRSISKSASRDETIAVLSEIHNKMQKIECKLRNPPGDALYSSLKGEFTECDIDFHLALLIHSGFERYQSELKKLIVQVLVGTQTMTIGTRPQEVIDEHSAIIDSITSGNQESIVHSLSEHMIGNARQWEHILRDRLAQSSQNSSKKADAARERKRFMRFKEQISEQCGKIFATDEHEQREE